MTTTSKKQQEVITLDSDDDQQQPPSTKPPTPCPVKIKQPPPQSPAITPTHLPSAAELVPFDGHELKEFLGYLSAIKKDKSICREVKMCLTCWAIVHLSELADHPKHLISGTFEQMQEANEAAVKKLCTDRGKVSETPQGKQI